MTSPAWDAFERGLLARTNFELAPGPFSLERLEAVLTALDRPERAYPVVHVAGTKGKGTTASALASALDASGLKVGLFTSPHLRDVRERIRIGARPAPDEAWLTAAQAVNAARPDLPLTYFEFLTALACVVYRAAQVDVAVFEVGLGGRLDATNVVAPAVCVITAIGRDHADVLGPDVASIAREKAGIVKPGVPVVAGPGHALAARVIEARAQAVKAPLLLLGRDLSVRADGELLRIATPQATYTVRPLWPGPTSGTNLALAVAALELLETRLKRDLRAELPHGFSRLTWHGRFQERICKTVAVVVDGAHDFLSAKALAESCRLRFGGKRVVLVLGTLAGKDHAAIAQALAPVCLSAWTCAPPTPRAAVPDSLAALLREEGVSAQTCHRWEEAWSRAFEQAVTHRAPLVVTGSLYLAGAVLGHLDVDTSAAWSDSA